MKAILLHLTSLVAVGPAAACPVCDTETGIAVRKGIFNESPDFHSNPTSHVTCI